MCGGHGPRRHKHQHNQVRNIIKAITWLLPLNVSHAIGVHIIVCLILVHRDASLNNPLLKSLLYFLYLFINNRLSYSVPIKKKLGLRLIGIQSPFISEIQLLLLEFYQVGLCMLEVSTLKLLI